jgi:hypothetical protein
MFPISTYFHVECPGIISEVTRVDNYSDLLHSWYEHQGAQLFDPLKPKLV